uniref:Nucleophosmin 1a n=1 Tax=Myripristis murdjan TaxID=586833 RepID=A0A668AMR0_9TELE
GGTHGCVLESGKDVVFNPEDDDFEHQLDLRMACVDPSTKDELHTVEVEGQDLEGQKVKAVLVSLKPSTLPSVCLGGFNITPPAVFRLKAGSGPIHISGQHLVICGGASAVDRKPCHYLIMVVMVSLEPAVTVIKIDFRYKSRLRNMQIHFQVYEEESCSLLQAKVTPPEAQTPAQNGKSSKPGTPGAKQVRTMVNKPLAVTLDVLYSSHFFPLLQGITLPKVQPKFENFAKHGYKVSDPKVIMELWKWRQTVKDAK